MKQKIKIAKEYKINKIIFMQNPIYIANYFILSQYLAIQL